MAFIRRLAVKFSEIQKNPPPLCYAEPEDSATNLLLWTGWIEGPRDTPYAGGKFRLRIDFSTEFPFRPPVIQFITPVFHPNIGIDGRICLDILHSQWSPALSVRALLISLCSLLTDPNPDHGLNRDALKLYRTDKSKYDETVKNWTMKHAMDDSN